MAKETAIQIEITPFRELPISDDYIFGHLMRDVEICRMFLEALLQKKIARVEIVSSQYEITDSYFSHGIRVDVYLADEAGTIYCVEMQTTIPKNLYKRIRYYQGAIDRRHLHKGDHYDELPETFIIFICTKDPFGYGRPIYRRKMSLEHCENSEYNDGSHVYFLNSEGIRDSAADGDQQDPAITEFLRCIRENDTEKSHYVTPLMVRICEAMEEIRDDPVLEADYMQYQAKLMDRENFGFERGRKEGREEGRKQGREEGRKQGREEGRKEGREEGREQGREEGIQAMVKALQGFSLSRNNAIQSLQTAFGLNAETAREKVDRYWNAD